MCNKLQSKRYSKTIDTCAEDGLGAGKGAYLRELPKTKHTKQTRSDSSPPKTTNAGGLRPQGLNEEEETENEKKKKSSRFV